MTSGPTGGPVKGNRWILIFICFYFYHGHLAVPWVPCWSPDPNLKTPNLAAYFFLWNFAWMMLKTDKNPDKVGGWCVCMCIWLPALCFGLWGSLVSGVSKCQRPEGLTLFLASLTHTSVSLWFCSLPDNTRSFIMLMNQANSSSISFHFQHSMYTFTLPLKRLGRFGLSPSPFCCRKCWRCKMRGVCCSVRKGFSLCVYLLSASGSWYQSAPTC